MVVLGGCQDELALGWEDDGGGGVVDRVVLEGDVASRSGAGLILLSSLCDGNTVFPNCRRRNRSRTSLFASSTSHSISPASGGRVP